MVVYNHFENDSRVRKEADTLATAGYDVHIVAIWKPGLPAYQTLGRVHVHRLQNTPFYIQMLGRKRFDRLKARLYAKGEPGNQKKVSPGYAPGTTGFASGGGVTAPSVYRQPLWRNLLQFSISTTKKILFTISFYQNVGCNTRDPQAILTNIRKVLEQYDLFAENVHKIRKKYCWEKESRVLMHIYQKLD